VKNYSHRRQENSSGESQENSGASQLGIVAVVLINADTANAFGGASVACRLYPCSIKLLVHLVFV